MPGGRTTRRSLTDLYATPPASAAEAAVETSQARRPRGRPRGRGGRGRGGARPTVESPPTPAMDEDQQPMDEDEQAVGLHTGGGDAPEQEVGEGSTSSSTVWLRGPARLPQRPILPPHRPVIRPAGDE